MKNEKALLIVMGLQLILYALFFIIFGVWKGIMVFVLAFVFSMLIDLHRHFKGEYYSISQCKALKAELAQKMLKVAKLEQQIIHTHNEKQS